MSIDDAGYFKTDGVLILAMKDLLNKIINQSKRKFYLRCSYFEIYNDNVHD